jgi:hypothetical protein
MPVNYQEIKSQIKEMGKQAPQRQEQYRRTLERACQALADHAADLDGLRQRVETAAAANNSLRCAVPTDEPLNAAFPLPQVDLPCVILAADGSQANPNRHDPVEFGVINIGAYRTAPGSADAPREITRSQLLYYDDLYVNGNPVSEDMLILKRDLAERRLLADLAAAESLPVVALTDGPLELFHEPGESAEFLKPFEDYLEALHRLSQGRTATAGYIDRPRYDYLVRLIEIATLPADKLANAGRERPLAGVSDRDLLSDSLAPGQRSAVYAIQSAAARAFAGPLKLHFFYINIGRQGNPYLARVEIPAWVAESCELLDLLHATLIKQCLQMGARPYPYALHRSHEVAVVSFAERQQVMDMITAELLRQGLPAVQPSNKQIHKDTSGSRTRYKNARH